jgi:hypothetical protein
MKSYRQKLNSWLDEKLLQETNQEIIKILTEVKIHVKSMESDEKDMVNRSYDKGYNDCYNKKNRKSNYYDRAFKVTDFLKKIVNK